MAKSKKSSSTKAHSTAVDYLKRLGPVREVVKATKARDTTLARRRIGKAPVRRKMSPCPQCGDTRGLCVSGAVKFVPEQVWSLSRRPRSARRSPSK
jgi:hypothetical protein